MNQTIAYYDGVVPTPEAGMTAVSHDGGHADDSHDSTDSHGEGSH